MKKLYDIPSIDISVFDAQNVIVASDVSTASTGDYSSDSTLTGSGSGTKALMKSRIATVELAF